MIRSTAYEYWASGLGLAHITPRNVLLPEGEGFKARLQQLVGQRTLLDFGCGVGRLAVLFHHTKYVGIDICPQALNIAQVVLPQHRFVHDDGGLLPEADITLAHTVLLHVPDDKLHPMITRFRSEVVIVSEILGRGWRRTGYPLVFNRNESDYQEAFWPYYDLVGSVLHYYQRYNTNLTLLIFKHNANPDQAD